MTTSNPKIIIKKINNVSTKTCIDISSINKLPNPVESYAWLASGEYISSSGKTWLLPNHVDFQNWITDYFYEYRLEDEQKTTKNKDSNDLFLYQRFIKSYISPETPYRGILVYHKLGSGKTRTAIATAEPFRKAGYKVVVFLPASLRNNFIDEIKRWGDSDLKDQSDQIILKAYKFVSYNANNALKVLQEIDFTNTVIIIDEVHNLLNMMTSAQSKHGKAIYKILMNAVNCRIIALSGTPLLNFTYELAILFNILRGYMGQNISLFPENEVEFEEYFVDYINEKAKNTEIFKRRTIGLISYYCGIQEELYPELVLHDVQKIEMSDFQFMQYWIVRSEEKNSRKNIIHTKKGNVSGVASNINFGDTTISKTRANRSNKYLVSNTFRPNSRQYCNFVFPENIDRPKSISKMNREILSNLSLSLKMEDWSKEQNEEIKQLFTDEFGDYNEDEYHNFIESWICLEGSKRSLEYLVQTIEKRGYLGKFNHIVSRQEEIHILSPETYDGNVRNALSELDKCQNEVLQKDNLKRYSQKMAKMLENINTAPGCEGKKFIYSNFRTLEGVEIFSRVLQVAGYTKFNSNLDISKLKQGLRYAIISGSESLEIRRAIIQAFNCYENRNGEYLMIILGTSSAAEGISLKHVRQIHIMEPWWNEVRVQQVIGRGRRIGSHLDLPENQRNVHVYRYLSVLSKNQCEKIDDPREFESTDEHVYNKAQKKARINNQFIQVLKESAVDCILNAAHNQNLKFGIKPLRIPSNLKYSFLPKIGSENIIIKKETNTALEKKMKNFRETRGQKSTNLVKFAPFRLNAKIKGLLGKSGEPNYIAFLDNNKQFKKSYVYLKNKDTNEIRKQKLQLAYALYDRVAAQCSNSYILRAYFVDRVGIVKKDLVTEEKLIEK